MTSKYYGVCLIKSYRTQSEKKDLKKWRAQIPHNNKTLRLGDFETEIEAAKAVDMKLIELKKYDKLNILKPKKQHPHGINNNKSRK